MGAGGVQDRLCKASPGRICGTGLPGISFLPLLRPPPSALLPFNCPRPPSGLAAWRPGACATVGHKGSIGTSGWIQQCQESRHWQLTLPGLPPSGRLSMRTFYCTRLQKPSSMLRRQVTMVLRVPECQSHSSCPGTSWPADLSMKGMCQG